MNLLSSFSDFYSRLSSDGLFFFWIVIFLFVFLIFLIVVLAVKNKKLNNLLKDEDNYNISISDKIDEKILFEEKEEKVEQLVETGKDENISKEEIIVEKTEDKKKDSIKDESGPYKKNVLREMTARSQTSPISISKSDVVYNSSYSDDYGLDEVYLREESVSPLETMEDSYEINDNMKFASEIVERMEEEVKPSNIELTEYEKKQEEEAIISYDELLKVKDKIYNLTEEEETDEFIDELKSFRLDL